MVKILVFLITFWVTINSVLAQTHVPDYAPAYDCNVPGKLTGFKFPNIPQADKIILSIHNYNIDSNGVFNYSKAYTIQSKNKKKYVDNIIISPSSVKTVVELPAFNMGYTWQVAYYKQGKVLSVSPILRFHVNLPPSFDTNRLRLRVLQRDTTMRNYYMLLDGNKALYNKRGELIWYLPSVEGIDNNAVMIRDLKMSCFNSLTFLNGDNAYEIDYYGTLKWKAPYDSTRRPQRQENYHHDFTRLPNGNYMTMSNDYITPPGDTAPKPYTTLMEYNAAGKVVWQWHATAFYLNTPPYYPQRANGKREKTLHGNAFAFDAVHKYVYVSFKNSCIVAKIKYPEGIVETEIGKKYTPEDAYSDNDFFCEQHNINISPHGYLYMYNNNLCHNTQPPTIVFLRQSQPFSNYEKIKELPVAVSNPMLPNPRRPELTQGGSVNEVFDDCYFVANCNPYTNLFIMDKQGKLLWNALPEYYDLATNKWLALPSYRAFIIPDKKTLYKLILAPL
ncbi:MAG: hypothetical protein EBX41_03955 [Chitinophagia bacterium]|nr:hypothetical protein [Chitinophagia bacterium]